jgi:hypothetical protein
MWGLSDEGRIASLFSRSELVREKWNREDYRRRTIARALGGITQFYSGGENGARPSRNGRPPAPEADGSAVGDLSLSSSLPQAAEFPVEAMPAPCRSLLEEATASLGCAPELVVLPMLAALSSAIGASRVVEVKGGWREGATLFLAVVASRRHEDPGGKGRQETGLRASARAGAGLRGGEGGLEARTSRVGGGEARNCEGR